MHSRISKLRVFNSCISYKTAESAEVENQSCSFPAEMEWPRGTSSGPGELGLGGYLGAGRQGRQLAYRLTAFPRCKGKSEARTCNYDRHASPRRVGICTSGAGTAFGSLVWLSFPRRACRPPHRSARASSRIGCNTPIPVPWRSSAKPLVVFVWLIFCDSLAATAIDDVCWPTLRVPC